MGQLAKRLMKACGKPVLVLFRPFLRRIDDYLNTHIAQLSAQMEIWQSQHLRALRDFDLLGDSLVREMVRLQLQISLLEENLHELVATANQGPAKTSDDLPALRRPPSQAA